MVLAMLLTYLVRVVLMTGISEATVLPLFTTIVMVYVWLKLLKQWLVMSKPLLAMTNPPTHEAVESRALALATAIAFLNLSSGPDPAVGSARDLPPKYETLEADLTAPPGYDGCSKGQGLSFYSLL